MALIVEASTDRDLRERGIALTKLFGGPFQTQPANELSRSLAVLGTEPVSEPRRVHANGACNVAEFDAFQPVGAKVLRCRKKPRRRLPMIFR